MMRRPPRSTRTNTLLPYTTRVRSTDGTIVALLPTAQARERFVAAECVSRPTSVVMPGLINAHVHNPMTLMRGVADDLPLMRWLTEHIWPIESAIMGPEYCAIGVELAEIGRAHV